MPSKRELGSARVYSCTVHTPTPPSSSAAATAVCGSVMAPGRRLGRFLTRKITIAAASGMNTGHMKMKSSTLSVNIMHIE